MFSKLQNWALLLQGRHGAYISCYATMEHNIYVVLNLHIDKEGYFSLQDIERSKVIADAIPNMDESLEIAVSQIPQAQPAIKTNVGVFVATTLKLPIMISAQ